MIARALTASMALALAAADGQAACVAAEFHGTVTASFDRAGTAGRGEGDGVLDGLTVRGVVVYDTALAPPDGQPSPELGVYATRNAARHWMAPIRLYLDGRPLDAPSFHGAVTSRDTDERMRVSGDGVLWLMRDLDLHDAATGEYLDYAVSLHLYRAPGDGDALPRDLPGAGTVAGRGSATLMYQAPHGPMGVHVGLEFRVLSIEPRQPAGLLPTAACTGV